MQSLLFRSIPVLSSFVVGVAISISASAQTVPFKLTIHDEQRQPVACRIHLKDEQGTAQRPTGLPFWKDHFVCSGQVSLDLAPGKYRYEIERGPEFSRLAGEVQLTSGKPVELAQTLKRISNLRASGWHSGDLHVHRKVEEVPLLMQAEDLDFAPTITWWNTRNLWSDRKIPNKIIRRLPDNRIYTIMAGEDEREGGALLYFGLQEPIDLTPISREVPSPMKFVREAHQRDPDVWIDIEKPFWWDVPLWLASGKMDSIGLANNHMCRSQMYESEAWGRPRDTDRLPSPRGNGQWTQEIYYHILNSGIRIPPSAGSASGVLPNPVGYNRVYAHLDQPFSESAWFEEIRQGRSFVTNGPLLVVRANQSLPGSALQLRDGEALAVTINVDLTSNDHVPELELIVNGQTVQAIPCEHQVHQQLTLRAEFNEPGWFLVRAVTDVPQTFRFASTAPWYLESSQARSPIRKSSSLFFQEWVEERIERVRSNVSDPAQLREVLEPHEAALLFWAERVRSATTE